MTNVTTAFESWWADIGEQSLFALNTTTDDDIKILAGIAWEAAIREASADHVAASGKVIAEQEPVGVVEGSGEWGIAGVLVAGVPIGTKLYAAPQPVSQEYQDHLVNQSFDWAAMAAKHQLMEGYRIGLAEMREKCAKVCEAKQSYSAMHANTEFAAVIRAINFEGDTGFRPVSEMIAEHKQDPKKAAAIEKAKMRKAEQEPEDIKLPVDVTIGCGTIKAGCSLQTLLTRIEVINHTWAPKLAYALNTPQLQAYQDKPFCMSDQATPRAKPANQEPVHEALQIASVALQDIACSSQTENLYWWQLRARKAQKQIAERLINAAPVQPVKQEPVAWCVENPNGNPPVLIYGNGAVLKPGDKLYAAPVRTKDLTEAEIDEIWKKHSGGNLGFAYAVIAADREKNK